MPKDSISVVIAKKSLPKILVRAFIWLLSLFAIGGVIDYFVNKELRAENKRMEEINRMQMDSMLVLMDSVEFQSTVVAVISFELDSLRKQRGKIRWKTVYKDTGSVRIDSVPYIVIDSTPVVIPVAVAEELNSCRNLQMECDKLKVQVDTLLAYIPTVIDSLSYQIGVLEEMVNPTWDLGIFKLPKPKDYCGITAGYNLIRRSVDPNSWPDYQTSSVGVSRWNITLGCGIGIRMGIL